MAEKEYLIQIIGYRKGHDKTSGKEFIYQKHFKDIKVSSVVNLFKNLDKCVAAIPEGERYDVHYSNANCHEPKEDKTIPLRLFHHQEMIPIDLDGIDLDKKETYIRIVIETLKIDPNKTGIFCSGNGLHFVVALTQPIESGEELHKMQRYYKALCMKLNLEFFEAGLMGNADPVRLAESATLRLPTTRNCKDPENPKATYVIQGNVETQSFYLDRLVDVKEDEEVIASTRAVDTKAVLSGCNFLKRCFEFPQTLSEPEWYAMLGTLAFIPEIGINLCHSYSEKHTDYSFEETQTKAEQAIGFGKPRTCESVSQVFPSCSACPHYKKIKTPLSIRGDDFISTETTGFHTMVTDANGVPKKPIPNYPDLVRYFNRKHSFVVNELTRQLHAFNGKHWQLVMDTKLENFATEHFKPVATNSMRSEFKGLILTSNVVDSEFFNKDSTGFINFNNGVLRLSNRELLPHSVDYGFGYVLPYDYNPLAKCPEFDAMLNNITLKDEELKKIILEYIGYAISGMNASLGAKSLLLTGGGSNGKSTLLNVIKKLVGKECYSAVSIKNLEKENHRYSMVGKLFNICEEIEENELKEGTATFKTIVTGGDLMVKKLYSDTVSMRLDAKLIISCNELPSSRENNHAIYRRMLIIPFKARFDKATGLDKNIEERISKEMSGVYNRILDALDRFIKNNYNFSDSIEAEKALSDYKYQNSIYNQFVDSCIESCGDDKYLHSEELMSMYNDWAHLNNVMTRPTTVKLVKELKTIGVLKESSVRWVEAKSKRVYTGIKRLGKENF